MPPLYVMQQGSKLVVNKGRLEVRLEDRVLASLPPVHVSEVVILGNVGLTTPAISLLLRRGIGVAFLSRRGAFKGRLQGCTSPHAALRGRQYALAEKDEFALPMAQAIVAAKVRHMRTCLRRWAPERKASGVWSSELEQLNHALRNIPQTTTHASLGGLEGSATAAYFSVYRRLFPAEWGFRRRARRPPPDPVNVLLSFGYTLLLSACLGAVEATGLDPFVGFLHQPAYNRPSLALDLMEEFRPLVDAIVLHCCRQGIVALGDFRHGGKPRPVIMGEQAKQRFILAFERRMADRIRHPVRGERLEMRRCILEQARQVARAIRDGKPTLRGMGFR